MRTRQPSRCSIVRWKASCAPISPWTRKVVSGGRRKVPSQRRSSSESACADIMPTCSIVAETGTIPP